MIYKKRSWKGILPVTHLAQWALDKQVSSPQNWSQPLALSDCLCYPSQSLMHSTHDCSQLLAVFNIYTSLLRNSSGQMQSKCLLIVFSVTSRSKEAYVIGCCRRGTDISTACSPCFCATSMSFWFRSPSHGTSSCCYVKQQLQLDTPISTEVFLVCSAAVTQPLL